MSLDTTPSRAPVTAADFVGRGEELAQLTRWLGDAAGGTGRLVTVAGEAGIGKTRLLRELVAQARRGGAIALLASCAEGDGPYAPFRAAFDAYVAEVAAERVRAQLGAGASVIAQLVPRLHERLPDLGAPARLPPNEERVRLLDAVSQFLTAIAATAPLVLALDDLHWADADTLTLLRHVGRGVDHQPLLLVAAYRDDEVESDGSLASTLAVLRRKPSAERVVLQGLTPDALAQLLRALAEQRTVAWAAGPVEPALAQIIGDQTRGNPFFIRSLIAQLEDEGRLRVEEGCWRAREAIDTLGLPSGVRALLSRRIGRLTAPAQRLLSVACLIGGTFRFDVAAAAADLSEDQALAAVDDALRMQIIEAAPELDSYAFVHAMVRQTFRDALPTSARVATHGRIAEALEHVYGQRAAEHAGEIARHLHSSAPLPGAQRGISYALLAAGAAERNAAFAAAAAFQRLANDLMRPDDPRRPRVLAQRGRNLALLQDGAAVAVAGEAAALIGDAEGPAASADYLASLVDLLFAAGAFAAAFAIARLGLPYAGDRRDAAWAAHAAMAVLERELADTDHPGIARDTSEHRAIGDQIAALAPNMPSYAALFIRGDRLAGGMNVTTEIYLRGEYRLHLKAQYKWAHAFADQLYINGSASNGWNLWATIARCHIALGELAQAREAMAHAMRMAERFPSSMGRLIFVAAADDWRAAVDKGWHRVIPGTWEDVLPWYRGCNSAMLARVHARMERTDAALRCVTSAVPAIEHGAGWADGYMMIVDRAAETLWLTGNTAHVDTIERNLRTKILASDYRYPMTDARLTLARLCALQRRYDEAPRWFAEARTVLEQQGARPLRAIVDYDEALMYIRRDLSGDRDRARPLLDAALEQFRSIDMPGWIRRAEGLAQDIAVPPPATGPTAPTPTRGLIRNEGDCWRIVYDGHTIHLRHSRGLTLLARLLAVPGQEIAAVDLVGDAEPRNGAPIDTRRRRRVDAGGPLDAPARTSYKQRVDELRADLADAEAHNDRGHVERLRAELDAITAELAGAVGQGGAARRAGTDAERARVNITRALGLVLRKIAAQHPALGEHLARTIRTGTFCSYAPDPRAPIDWQV